jgi:TonB family protein
MGMDKNRDLAAACVAPLVITIIAAPVAAQDQGDWLPPPSPPTMRMVPPPVPPPPPPPAPTLARPATPANSPATWIGADDYPSSAIREGAEGSSRFVLEIDPDGRVANCTITSSSGYASLDEGTCSIVTLRARFNPALDSAGNPTSGSYSNVVRWEFPLYPIDAEAMVEFAFVLDENGVVGQCEMVSEVGIDDIPFEPDCYDGDQFLPLTDAEGNPVARRVRIRYEVTYEPVD